MTGAFVYLTATASRNWLSIQLRRLRQPRYAVAVVIGVFYIWSFLVRQDAETTRMSQGLLGTPAETLAALGLLMIVAGAWLSSTGRLALAFSEAEVQFLFPAPVSRRGLVAYRLLRGQLPIAINVLVWVLILKRGDSHLPLALRALAIWALFSTLAMHRIGAALVRASWVEHRGAGLSRQRATALVFIAVLGALAWSVIAALPQMTSASGGREVFSALTVALTTGPAAVVLAPIRWIIAPTFAWTASEWLGDIGPALLILLAAAAWVFRSDTAFEEAAVQASADRARRMAALRGRRAGVATVTRAARRTFSLGAKGSPATAIVWKNMLCLIRTVQLTGLLSVLVVAVMMSLIVASEAGGGVPRFVAVTAVAFAALLMLMGGRVVRNDMRQDMAHLATLKTAPVSGRAIVAAEIASSAVFIGAVQVVLLVIAYVAMFFDPDPQIDLRIRTIALFTAPIALFIMDVLDLTIQNGGVVLFPSWTQIGPRTSGGVEVLGQGVLTVLASFLLMILALILPAIIATVGVALTRWSMVGLVVSIVAALAVVILEIVWVVGRLGRAFERAEPTQLT